MTTRLIVNADDFGLTPGVNRAIVELHAAGVVTSATLMAGGPAFTDAVACARQHPALGIGCHVVLTDGMPVSLPDTIPTLLGADRRSFRPSLKTFLLDLMLRKISIAEIELEIVAQIEAIQATGLHVTHLDTHKHTHVGSPVADALLRAAERTGVRAVRNPFEEPWSLKLGQTRTLRLLSVAGASVFRPGFLRLPQIRSGRVLTTRGTLGISATGNLTEGTLRQLLDNIPEGTWELVCHPGYNDRDLDAIPTRLRETREIEYKALLAALLPQTSKPQTSSLNITPHRPRPKLIHYGELAERAGPESEPRA